MDYIFTHSVNAVGSYAEKPEASLQKNYLISQPLQALAVKPYYIAPARLVHNIELVRFRHTPISLATTFGIIGYSHFLDLLR